MLFLSQGLIEMIRNSLNKFIQNKGFPYALNQVFYFEMCSNIYNL